MKITKKILQNIIKEEISKMVKEQDKKEEESFVEDDYDVGDMPSNKVLSTEQVIPEILKEIRRVKSRLRKLEVKLKTT